MEISIQILSDEARRKFERALGRPLKHEEVQIFEFAEHVLCNPDDGVDESESGPEH
jgi:hypothetical protein